ncbi:hypothetical protein D6C89_07579, partial [Aureobasidium pullulans]
LGAYKSLTFGKHVGIREFARIPVVAYYNRASWLRCCMSCPLLYCASALRLETSCRGTCTILDSPLLLSLAGDEHVLWQAILDSQTPLQRPRPARDPFYLTGKFNPYHDNLFSRLDLKEHKWAKSRTLAAYSGRKTLDLEVGVNNLIETLIAKIALKYAAPTANSQTACFLDLGKTSCYFTLDVITRLAFGREFSYLEHEKDHYNFLRSLHDLWPQMSTCIRKFLFSKPFLTLLGLKTTDKAGFGALIGVAEHYVAKRFSLDAKLQQDMLLTNIKGSMMKHGLNQTECETKGLFMIIAGTESTASTIRLALVHTITTPRVYKALKQEITKAMANSTVSSPISMVEARNLPYLRAVVYEGLRMRPLLIGYFLKVVPRSGEEILGHHLPAGTAIGINMSAVLSLIDLFGPDADLFRLERFLELNEGRRKQIERNVKLAFGNGQ